MEMQRYPRLRLIYNEEAASSQNQLPLYAVSDTSQRCSRTRTAAEPQVRMEECWLKTASFN